MKNFYRRRKPFTQISNAFVQSDKISSKAKIVMCVMQSLPDTWKYSVNGLRGYFKESKDFIQTGIHDLENLGYLVRIQLQKEHGKFGQNIYIMDDEVVTVDYIVEILIENEITSWKQIYEILAEKEFSTTIEEICAILARNGIEVDLNDVNTSFSPLSTFPSTVNPMTENSTLINNIIINNKTRNKSSQSKSNSNCKENGEFENDLQIADMTDLTDKENKKSQDNSVRSKAKRSSTQQARSESELTETAQQVLREKFSGGESEQESNADLSASKPSKPDKAEKAEPTAHKQSRESEQDSHALKGYSFSREDFKVQIGYDRLIRDKPEYERQIATMVDIVNDALTVKSDTVRVAKLNLSKYKAIERFSQLTDKHILYVLQKFYGLKQMPQNAPAYILTMLYQAPSEYSPDYADAFNSGFPPEKDGLDSESYQSFNLDDLMALANRFD